MYYLLRFSFLIFVLQLASSVNAQLDISNLGFGYSALVRDTSGRIQTNKPVKLKFTLLIGQNGTVANSPWIEEHNSSTDGFGFVNVSIGQGSKTGGTAPLFKDIDFTLGNYWILVEVYNTFQQQYEPLAKTAMQSVPYAKVAGQLASGSAVPAGTIVAFAGPIENIPAGWLPCNGQSLSASDPRYLRLFNAIRTSWGAADGAGTFQVPYTNGMFLRGVSYDGVGQDPDKDARIKVADGGNTGNRVGSFQRDEFESHNHPVNINPANAFMNNDGRTNSVEGGGSVNYSRSVITATSNFVGGTETRPANVYVNYIIKL